MQPKKLVPVFTAGSPADCFYLLSRGQFALEFELAPDLDLEAARNSLIRYDPRHFRKRFRILTLDAWTFVGHSEVLAMQATHSEDLVPLEAGCAYFKCPKHLIAALKSSTDFPAFQRSAGELSRMISGGKARIGKNLNKNLSLMTRIEFSRCKLLEKIKLRAEPARKVLPRGQTSTQPRDQPAPDAAEAARRSALPPPASSRQQSPAKAPAPAFRVSPGRGADVFSSRSKPDRRSGRAARDRSSVSREAANMWTRSSVNPLHPASPQLESDMSLDIAQSPKARGFRDQVITIDDQVCEKLVAPQFYESGAPTPPKEFPEEHGKQSLFLLVRQARSFGSSEGSEKSDSFSREGICLRNSYRKADSLARRCQKQDGSTVSKLLNEPAKKKATMATEQTAVEASPERLPALPEPRLSKPSGLQQACSSARKKRCLKGSPGHFRETAASQPRTSAPGRHATVNPVLSFQGAETSSVDERDLPDSKSMRLLRSKIELAKDIVCKIQVRCKALESQPFFDKQKAQLLQEVRSLRAENAKLSSMSRIGQEKEMEERFKGFSALAKTEQYCSSLQTAMNGFKQDSIESRSLMFLKKYGKPSVRTAAKTKIAFDQVKGIVFAEPPAC